MYYYYSYYTQDRSGAQLINILQNYYYCFVNNLQFGGAIKQQMYNTYHYNKSIQDTIQLMKFLNIPNLNPNPNNKIINKSDTSYNIPFRNMLYNNMRPNLRVIHKDIQDFIVCLHIRRGDVQKNNRWNFRYTDDTYYFDLINEIQKHKPESKIYIFSEKNFEQEEHYKTYIELGCIMKLDTSLIEAFNYFIQCDIFIMASSAFSHVPAIYKKHGLVIFTWSKYFKPLGEWINSDNIEDKKTAIKNYINREKPLVCRKCNLNYRRLHHLKNHIAICN